LSREIIESFQAEYNLFYWAFIYRFLNQLGSFPGDIVLTESIMINNSAFYPGRPEKTERIDIFHCIDQHCFPNIGHFVNPPVSNYVELYQEIWNKVSSANPRKNILYNPMDPFVAEIRRAQALIWISKFQDSCRFLRPSLPETIQLSHQLDPEFISGMIGDISITKVAGLIVVMRSENADDVVVIRRPGREEKDIKEVTPEEEQFCRSSMKDKLSKGLKLKVPSTMSSDWKDLFLYWNENENEGRGVSYLYLKETNTSYFWDDLRIINRVVPSCEKIELSLESAILHRGNGIQVNADQDLVELISHTDPKVLFRLKVYIGGYRKDIQPFDISREGKSEGLSVSPLDTDVFHLLAKISVLYPHCLELEKTKFVIKDGSMFWRVRDIIINSFPRIAPASAAVTWPAINTQIREPFEYQIEIVQEMITKNQKQKKGHLIWATVGSGKTLCVILYLDYLITNNIVPKYCVYTLPESAMKTVTDEFLMYGIPCHILDMTKGKDGKKDAGRILRPWSINFVKHDHLRLGNLHQELIDKSGEILFIVDEFHKALSETKRSSICLEISKLSADFIALSGTIIKDEKPSGLIEWLNLIVNYEVTENNYWSALGAMISRYIRLDIKVNRQDMEAELTEEEKIRYNKLVPATLGGTAVKTDLYRAADVCYEACTRQMIELALLYYEQKFPVFLVAKDAAYQKIITNSLVNRGLRVFKITKDNSIDYSGTSEDLYDAVVTTVKLNSGYTLTKIGVMITCVYFTNQFTREQLEGRIVRQGQIYKEVAVVTLHAGFLTNILAKYRGARNLVEAMKKFAQEIEGVQSNL
jgi:hypothetical protein